ncbi:MAG: hypothetical protein H6718_25530 [Polyangiaceae bacterium]|nr:hypothetical protein [Polyangiaceae bacterium]MCB9605357.1 hypothetical protein [Polyangiaceae bacterium]
MNQRSKGVLYILVGAAAAGVYLEVKHHEHEGTLYGPSSSATASQSNGATPSASPPSSATTSAATGTTSAPPPQAQELKASDVQALHDAIGDRVRKGASDAGSPWAMAHGLIAFGKDFKASDGQDAVDAIAKLLVLDTGASGKPTWQFPPGSPAAPSEPHPHLIVDVLLQVGVSPSRELTTQTGRKISLQTLIDQALRDAKDPTTEPEWIDSPWLLDLLTRTAKGKNRATRLAPVVWEQLSKQTQLIADYRGAPERAFANGTPLFEAKRNKTQIYGHHCGGLHFMQAALSLEASVKAEPQGVAPELDRLLKRIALERSTYNALDAQTQGTPAARLLLVQELKFFGHSAETLGLARELELYDPTTNEGKRLDAALRALAWDLKRVFDGLEQDSAYKQLDAIKSERVQTYLDLIGDGCHAMRGLKRALPAFDQTAK